MTYIICSLHKYVPRDSTTETVAVSGQDVPVVIMKSNFFKIGLGKTISCCVVQLLNHFSLINNPIMGTSLEQQGCVDARMY